MKNLFPLYIVLDKNTDNNVFNFIKLCLTVPNKTSDVEINKNSIWWQMPFGIIGIIMIDKNNESTYNKVIGLQATTIIISKSLLDLPQLQSTLRFCNIHVV